MRFVTSFSCMLLLLAAACPALALDARHVNDFQNWFGYYNEGGDDIESDKYITYLDDGVTLSIQARDNTFAAVETRFEYQHVQGARASIHLSADSVADYGVSMRLKFGGSKSYGRYDAQWQLLMPYPEPQPTPQYQLRLVLRYRTDEGDTYICDQRQNITNSPSRTERVEIYRDGMDFHFVLPDRAFEYVCTANDPQPFESDKFGISLEGGTWSQAAASVETTISNVDLLVDAGENLVAYYPFEGAVDDGSGNGNHGQAQGGLAYGPGVFGQAAVFDGDQASVVVPDDPSLDFAGGFTIAGWVLVDPDHKPNSWLAAKATSFNDQQYSLYLTNSAHQPRFCVNNDPVTDNCAMDEASRRAGQWTHIAGVYDSGTMHVYRNGQLLDSVASAAPVAGDGSLYIGMLGGQYFTGKIDEVRLYDAALTAQDVQELYLAESPLVASYPFDGSVQDASGFARHGTAQGALAFGVGVSGQAAVFNGHDAYVEVTDASFMDFAGNFTIAGWARVDSDHSVNAWIVARADGLYDQACSLYLTNGALRPRFCINNTPVLDTCASSGSNTAAERWTHIAGVYEDGVMHVYRDGQLQDSAASDEPAQSLAPLLMGQLGGQYLTGLLDELQIYDTALAAGDVRFLYEGYGALNPNRTPPLLLLLK